MDFERDFDDIADAADTLRDQQREQGIYTCPDGCGLTGDQWVMQEHLADPWHSTKHRRYP